MAGTRRTEQREKAQKYSRIFAEICIPIFKEYRIWSKEIIPHGYMDQQYFQRLREVAGQQLPYSKLIEMLVALKLKLQDKPVPHQLLEQQEFSFLETAIDNVLWGYSYHASEVGMNATQNVTNIMSILQPPEKETKR